jgi:hypothetical protein
MRTAILLGFTFLAHVVDKDFPREKYVGWLGFIAFALMADVIEFHHLYFR